MPKSYYGEVPSNSRQPVSLRGRVLCLLMPSLFLLSTNAAIGADSPAAGPSRAFVDSAGRRIDVPTKIERVFAAGPPASIILYTLAPEKLLGWNRSPLPQEQAYMPERYARLPELGRLTGRGNTANVELVLQVRPDVILDYGTLRATYASLADRVQVQIGVPYVLLDGAFQKIPSTYRLLGTLLGAQERAERLAAYAEHTLSEVTALMKLIPADRRPRVYYGRGPDGLETGLGGSINVELLEFVGAVNVAAEGAARGGLASVSMEQVLKWDPQVVLTLERRFFESVQRDPTWRKVRALREGRVYLAPSVPFGWFDRPPSVNRLIGVKWLLSVLYPEHVSLDMRFAARDFYRLFYHIELDNGQLDRLLEHAVHGRK